MTAPNDPGRMVRGGDFILGPVSRAGGELSPPADEPIDAELCSHPRPAFRYEWRELAAAWGFGGICNAVDALALPDPESAPAHIIEAARLLRFVAEDLGLDAAHPLGSETWRAEP